MSAEQNSISEFCDWCGHRKANTAPIKRGAWYLTTGQTLYNGRSLPLTVTEARLLFELAKIGGRLVKGEILGGWISASGHPAQLARVMVWRIRKALGKDRTPIETVGQLGYCWKDVA